MSLEGFIGPGHDDVTMAEESTASSCDQYLTTTAATKPSVHVLVTPGSPAKPSRRESTSKINFAMKSPTKPIKQFLFYVTDQVVDQKWVVAHSSEEYTTFRSKLTHVIGNCKTFRCCGPLRRVITSPIYKKPSKKWMQDSVVSQCTHANVIQEYINDLLQSVLSRDCQCESTVNGLEMIYQFLQVGPHRKVVATRRLSVAEAVQRTDSNQFDKACPICFTELGDHAVRLPCEHTYHTDCIHTWFTENHSCPVCRSDLRESFLEQSPPEAAGMEPSIAISIIPAAPVESIAMMSQ
jgi:hypothetical protein